MIIVAPSAVTPLSEQNNVHQSVAKVIKQTRNQGNACDKDYHTTQWAHNYEANQS
jgi:hypothetical protein